MTLCRLFSLAVLMLISARSLGADYPEGCLDPNAIAGGLEKLGGIGWQNVSLQRLRSIWPTELDGLDCNSAVCQSVWSKDRIIKGHCECCTTFYFDVERSANAPKVEKLQNIIINYTGKSREEIVAVARSLATASGLRKSDATTIGDDALGNFSWKSRGEENKELYGLEVRFTSQGALWELYFNLARHTIDPTSGALR